MYQKVFIVILYVSGLSSSHNILNSLVSRNPELNVFHVNSSSAAADKILDIFQVNSSENNAEGNEHYSNSLLIKKLESNLFRNSSVTDGKYQSDLPHKNSSMIFGEEPSYSNSDVPTESYVWNSSVRSALDSVHEKTTYVNSSEADVQQELYPISNLKSPVNSTK